jgi:uncharacterized protein YciI
MFIILLDYTRPLDEVDTRLAAHRQFLRDHYASGHFLMSGPKEPRTGGVIICAATNRAEVDTLIEQDPFYVQRVAEYRVIEFVATAAAPELQRFVMASSSLSNALQPRTRTQR